ncbi:class I SAM-dependent methyltransferase [Candidatus Enterococcus mansonii]|uniref:Methyltransferase type 11 domain-containing protein n=1 Tax=Candidatus Enterococcus mansonii TaxID=1834181 RepID=A0A242CJ25_9ENTE|nr:methyltransferase domain-containing protein [Enterococcus sp. 4G2_DIV0659]OTO10159.1 hypothetical protein A5880_000842 [Enterococcus sp. 4G2_DIV0659]
MDKELLRRYWQTIEQKRFIGWDFSYMKDRWDIEPLPWEYSKIVRDYLSREMNLLDMGTGGGELLQTFEHPYERTTVTEGWLPNFKLLKERLEPKGVNVTFVNESDQLSLSSESFDIAINSHASYDPKEVRRVLKNQGVFITQQVGDQNGRILAEQLIPNVRSKYTEWSLKNAQQALIEESFDILFAKEYFPYQHFFDMEGLIYYVKRIPWEYPDFQVHTHFEQLIDRQNELLQKGYIHNNQHRFMIVCKVSK